MMTLLRKLWKIFTPSQRIAAIGLLGLMFIGMCLETLGVGLVVPAVALMADADLIQKYPEAGAVFALLGNPDREQLVIIGTTVLVGVYAVKAFFLAFLAWKQTKFVFGMQANLSQRLFTGYLHQPYTFHLQRNSAQLIRNATTEVGMFATVTQSVMMLLSEGLVLFGLSCLLFAVEPIGALIVIVTLGVAGGAFYKVTKKHISRWGKARQFHEGMKIQHLQQGLGGAKDVKLLGREADFLAQYTDHSNRSAHVSQRQNVFQQFPRLWLEFLAIVGLGILVAVMIAQGKSPDSLLPTLGLFAAAAFRLMPSVNRILIAIQSLRYAVPVINTLHEEFQAFNESLPSKSIHADNITTSLSLDNVSFCYAGADRNAVESVNIEIHKGSSVGFIGGSGAGKSTLVDVILGLLSPSIGEVRVDGKNIEKNIRGWQDQIGYVPQSIFLTDDTLRRNIAFGLSEDQIDDDAVKQALKLAQLEFFAKELPDGLDTLVGERGVRLSGGQRQRIGIARALYHDPSVLVLDEATSALDTDTEKSVMSSVEALQGDKTILIIAHRLSTVKNCDYLFRFENGLVVESGAPESMLRNVAITLNGEA